MAEQKHDHFGHRDRVKKEFLQNGFNKATPPHKVLELLLFYSIPQKDTNEIAHELIKNFHTLSGVIDAPVEELTKIKGITENTATLFKLIIPVSKLYSESRRGSAPVFRNIDEVGDYVLMEYMGFKDETFSIVSLDNSGTLKSFDIIEQGDISAVSISTRKIIELVIKTGANAIVLVHNHPGGVALPSGADVETTQQIQNALKHVSVRLIDHIIIAEDDFVSMAQSEKYCDMFK